MAVTNHTRWSDISGGSQIISYEPGDEVTNVGLLFTRVYPTYDGTDSASPVKVSSALEKATLYGSSPPTVSSLNTLYGGKNYYLLPCLEKQVPGLDNTPIWTLMTDHDNELVGRSYAGKPESLSTIGFSCPAVFGLIDDFTDHAAHNSVFTILQCYDDGNLDDLYYIVVPRCTLAGVTTSQQKNNSGGTMNLKFKPMGGQFIPRFISTPRTTGQA